MPLETRKSCIHGVVACPKPGLEHDCSTFAPNPAVWLSVRAAKSYGRDFPKKLRNCGHSKRRRSGRFAFKVCFMRSVLWIVDFSVGLGTVSLDISEFVSWTRFYLVYRISAYFVCLFPLRLSWRCFFPCRIAIWSSVRRVSL